jgi:hypothetical protein
MNFLGRGGASRTDITYHPGDQIMIETLTGLPDNEIGFSAHGKVTADD